MLDIAFAAVVINSNAEYLANEVSEQSMFEMFEADITYGLTLIIVHVSEQCHLSNSEYNGKTIYNFIFSLIKCVLHIL